MSYGTQEKYSFFIIKNNSKPRIVMSKKRAPHRDERPIFIVYLKYPISTQTPSSL